MNRLASCGGELRWLKWRGQVACDLVVGTSMESFGKASGFIQ